MRTRSSTGSWRRQTIKTRNKLKQLLPPRQRRQITNFKQGPTEDLNEAWVRYKRLIRSVPHHGFQKWYLCNTFYNGLYDDHRSLLDSAANGRFQNNTNDDAAWKIIDNMATHTAEYGNPRGAVRGSGSDSALAAQLEALTAKIAELQTTQSINNKQTVNVMQQVVTCGRCGIEGHVATECMSSLEQVNAFHSYQQGVPYSNFYQQAPNQPYVIPANRGAQPGNFNRQNQGGGVPFNNQRPPFQPLQPPPQAPSTDLSEMKAMFQQSLQIQQQQAAQISELLAHNKILETQMAQLAVQNPPKQQGSLPPRGKQPHEQVNAISLRSGTSYEGPEMIT